MTEQHPVAPTLGERLDALARRRFDSVALQPVWTVPAVRAIERGVAVAAVLGDRFDRVETTPRDVAEPPAELLDRLAELPARQALQRPAGRWPGPAGAAAPGPARHGAAADGAPDGGAPDAPDAPDEDDADSELRALPGDVLARLRREVGAAADLMRVHHGPRADALARSADADAVTVGRDVHLRRERWAPRTEEGLALLAHEATHVAALIDPGVAWRRASGEAAEEALALARERSVLGTAPYGRGSPAGAAGHPAPVNPPRGQAISAPAAPAASSGSSPSAAHSGGGAPAMHRAGSERDLAPAAAPDLDALRRSVIADVMSQLRTEIERGA